MIIVKREINKVEQNAEHRMQVGLFSSVGIPVSNIILSPITNAPRLRQQLFGRFL
jgi:hypothetical protein